LTKKSTSLASAHSASARFVQNHATRFIGCRGLRERPQNYHHARLCENGRPPTENPTVHSLRCVWDTMWASRGCFCLSLASDGRSVGFAVETAHTACLCSTLRFVRSILLLNVVSCSGARLHSRVGQVRQRRHLSYQQLPDLENGLSNFLGE
jgi:hypothetical protein